MVCVNSKFSRKDNCEKFAHAFAAYIGLEVEKWFGIYFTKEKQKTHTKRKKLLTPAGNLYRIHNREFIGTTSNWIFRLSYDLLYKDASKQQKQPAHANLKPPLKYFTFPLV